MSTIVERKREQLMMLALLAITLVLMVLSGELTLEIKQVLTSCHAAKATTTLEVITAYAPPPPEAR